MIEKSRLGGSSDEIEEVLKKLERSPVPLSSSSMQVSLSATAHGLTVTVKPNGESEFYRVDLKGNASVRDFLDRHRDELDRERDRVIDASASEFVDVFRKVLEKKLPPERITGFRDSLALPSMVQGLGQQVVAAYGRGVYRCVYQDPDGAMYFLLPGGVKEFEIRGREDTKRVSAELNVKVTGEIEAPKNPSEKPNPKPPSDEKSKSNEKDEPMDEDKQTGKN
jgi:hypothetical protein